MPRLRLYNNWKNILRHAWSIKLMAFAGVTSGLEAALPFIHDAGYLKWLPGGMFAILVFFVSLSAMVARLVFQESLGEYDE